MGSDSSRSSTETSLSIWRRSKPTRAARWSFVTRCEDIVASHGTSSPDQAMERTATRQENYKGEIRKYMAAADLCLVRRRYERTENFRAVSNHQIRRTT